MRAIRSNLCPQHVKSSKQWDQLLRVLLRFGVSSTFIHRTCWLRLVYPRVGRVRALAMDFSRTKSTAYCVGALQSSGN